MKKKQVLRLSVIYPCLLLVLGLMPSYDIAAETISEEYKIKAALIYKLTRFVEWPAKNGRNTSARFGLCVLGRDDFGSALEVLKGYKVDHAVISIQRFKRSQSINKYCQLVFISDSKQDFFRQIIKTIGKQPILTIGDSPTFAEKGGMIQLSYSDKRIDFKINLQQVKVSGLKIAAPLLEMATIINSSATRVNSKLGGDEQ